MGAAAQGRAPGGAALLRFAAGHAAALLARDPQSAALAALPALFQARRVLELLLTASKPALDALAERPQHAQAFPPVVRLWATAVRPDLIDRRLIGELRRLLVKPLTEPPGVRVVRLRFVLFAAPLVVTDLLPSNFLALPTARDLLAGYKDALAQIIAAAGTGAVAWVVRDIAERLAPARGPRALRAAALTVRDGLPVSHGDGGRSGAHAHSRFHRLVQAARCGGAPRGLRRPARAAAPRGAEHARGAVRG
jgi:hypothetical protein